MGFQALQFNTSGFSNVALGSTALYNNTTGESNVAVGYGAGAFNNLNTNCTFVGYDADQAVVTDFDNSTAIGNTSRITASNQVRIGNATVSSIGGYAAWTNVSDARVKMNVQENVPGLDFIMLLRPVTYNLNVNAINEKLNVPDSSIDQQAVAEKTEDVQTGFIAQEVEEAANEIGYEFSGVDTPESETDLYGLRYSEFVVPLVQAMQEQQEMILKQQEQIELLKLEIELLKSR